MEKALLSKEDLVCVICTQVPSMINETECWGTILWSNCLEKIEKCPNNCEEERSPRTRPCSFLQRIANQFLIKWKNCWVELDQDFFDEHKEKCKKKTAFHNSKVHKCKLLLTRKKKWIWDGSLFIKSGWAKYGKVKKYRKSQSFYCKDCEFDLWSSWVEKYEDNSKSSFLERS